LARRFAVVAVGLSYSIGKDIHKIIIGDNQAFFRAGIAELLMQGKDNRVVAQRSDSTRLYQAMTFPKAIVIVASSIKPDLARLMIHIHAARSCLIIVATNDETSFQYTSNGASRVIFRSANAAVPIDCVRRMAAGDRTVSPVGEQFALIENDRFGSDVLARLTCQELKILSLGVTGTKNREIGVQLDLGTQAAKNYLTTIFDKAGVTTRLEVAVFTRRHRVLAAAAIEAGRKLEPERSVPMASPPSTVSSGASTVPDSGIGFAFLTCRSPSREAVVQITSTLRAGG
jgi:DNA-binding NarL/FixJ family response regulator